MLLSVSTYFVDNLGTKLDILETIALVLWKKIGHIIDYAKNVFTKNTQGSFPVSPIRIFSCTVPAKKTLCKPTITLFILSISKTFPFSLNYQHVPTCIFITSGKLNMEMLV